MHTPLTSLLLAIIFCATTHFSVAFLPPLGTHREHVAATTTTQVNGMFDMFKEAFSNEEYDDRRAKASHILVKTEESALEIKAFIENGVKTFPDAARAFSTCPSSEKGGDLGVFEPGTMVKEFDAVCFDASVPVGDVVGPVQTQFGYHLIQVQDRFKNTEKTEGTGAF